MIAASSPQQSALWCKSRWKHAPGGAAAEKGASSTEAHDGEWLVCVRCGNPITRAEDAADIGGAHVHSRVNPHGYLWQFRCFSAAPGGRGQGPLTSEFTWFPGYLWQIVECQECALHLGWRFVAEGGLAEVAGLIVERVVEPS